MPAYCFGALVPQSGIEEPRPLHYRMLQASRLLEEGLSISRLFYALRLVWGLSGR
jgi:hypothetical protein